MTHSRVSPALRALVVLAGGALLGGGSSACSSSSPGGAGGAGCYPDNDGITDDAYTVELTVDDAGFSKTIIATQNDSQVTLTVKNAGTKPHGFEVACTDARASYPNLPAGCSSTVCFPPAATIAPLDPGASKTIVFDTPVPDGLIYPFKSSEPDDGEVPALNDGQWSLM
jgi:hypothetical protein